MNNVAPPPRLTGYHQHSMDKAQPSPDTITPAKQVSLIFQDKSLQKYPQQYSYDSTDNPQTTLVYNRTEKSKDQQDIPDIMQLVPPTEQRKQFLSSQLSDPVGWNSNTSDATPTNQDAEYATSRYKPS
jgi:hypothetical protein